MSQARTSHSEAGFSLPELLIAVTILLVISSAVTQGLLQITNSQRTIANRTEMHSGVRSATELLQQEVGQAGRLALPNAVTLTAAVIPTATTAVLSSVSGVFVGERLVVDPGSWNQMLSTTSEETVVVSAINTVTRTITISQSIDATGAAIQASFVNAHLSGATVTAMGGFSSGIVPPSMTNGSTATTLKLYGDINADGNMIYVEYTCDPLGGVPGTGNLYRNVMPFDQATPKVAANASQALLTNIQANPNNTACFTYTYPPTPIVNGNTYVVDVAITLTVQTQVIDPLTKQFQTETKALLNVSPRNVFNTWELASAGINNRVQPMPPTVTALLP